MGFEWHDQLLAWPTCQPATLNRSCCWWLVETAQGTEALAGVRNATLGSGGQTSGRRGYHHKDRWSFQFKSQQVSSSASARTNLSLGSPGLSPDGPCFWSACEDDMFLTCRQSACLYLREIPRYSRATTWHHLFTATKTCSCHVRVRHSPSLRRLLTKGNLRAHPHGRWRFQDGAVSARGHTSVVLEGITVLRKEYLSPLVNARPSMVANPMTTEVAMMSVSST